MTPDQLRKFALVLPQAEEKAHFERTSFRVRNKIFATLSEDETEAVLKLTVEEQTALIAAEPDTFFLVGWNQQGWTGVKLASVDAEEMRQLLIAAWRNVASKLLIAKYEKSK
ncbi:MAG: MmcQ/YjbR family DNA-binding protein [Anaerolineae bacterium]|nr:MmcQ/YjbR family DNA-binding protein [Anaerolineae bacterium]